MSQKTVKIGLIGFGTVGAGVAKILLEESGQILQKTGLNIELARIVDKDIKSQRPVKLPKGMLTKNLDALINDKSIDIAVELVGGTGFAKDLHIKLLESGKHVVTANKALLAEHGNELYRVARKNNKCIAFEASCAGGIPIISAIRTGLAANRIEAIYGIVNGTCNYILTNMTKKGLSFKAALKKAQQKGFAEADPTLDINGHDSAHKLVIMASFAFGYEFKIEDVHIEGIENISIDDIRYAEELGYVLKLLAIAKHESDGTISLRVHPSFLHEECALARVDGSFNAISIFGHAVGQTMFYGRGAGMMPTASAVVSDIIDVALGNSITTFNSLKLRGRAEIESKIGNIQTLTKRFYIRLMAKDEPGVFSKYSKILGDNNISISGALQHEGTGPENTVPVVITTHPTRQENIDKAIKQLTRANFISGKPVCIRIVDIPEDNID
jgi:homoserine dehydrogenase